MTHTQRCQITIEDFNKGCEDGEPRKIPRRLPIFACPVSPVTIDRVLQQLLEIDFVAKTASWAGPKYPTTIGKTPCYTLSKRSRLFLIDMVINQTVGISPENLAHRENEAFRRQPHAPRGAPRWSP